MRYKLRTHDHLDGVECEVISTFIRQPLSIKHHPYCWGRFYSVKLLRDVYFGNGEIRVAKNTIHEIHNLDLQFIDEIDEYIIAKQGKI
jgi:hypothetical protein